MTEEKEQGNAYKSLEIKETNSKVKIAFVYGKNSSELLKKIKKHKLSSDFTFIDYESFMHQKMDYDRVLISGDIDEIKALFFRAISNDFEVAIIPSSLQVSLLDSFSLSKNLSENLEIALNNKAKPMDILYANGQIVLHTALVGDAPPLSYRLSKYRHKTLNERIVLLYEAYKKVKLMRHTKIKLTTQKNNEVETVATGIVVIEHDNKTCASRIVNNTVSTNDNKLDALIISPNSIVEYLQFIGRAIFVKQPKSTLPSSVGYMKSELLKLESKVILPLNIDGKEAGETPVVFNVKPKALKIALAESFWKDERKEIEDKETIKVNNLPKSIEKINYLQKRLPFFTHAGKEQYQNLFATLREEGRMSASFLILMLLSSILVTIGLYLNSASVIIGAMLLAPLMNPIVAFSMGMLRQDIALLVGSLKTIGVGVLVTLLTSAFIAWVLPFEHITQEMAGRIKPSILDMIVAIVSGMAAAYVKNNDKLSATIAGVAIAVALVPPIATAGIGLGWGDWMMSYQAFLLFLTNLVGISFAASVVFFIQGFSPMQRAKKGLFYTLVISIIITLPLVDSFRTMVKDANTISNLEHTTFEIEGREVVLQNVSLTRDTKIEVIKCELLVVKTLNNRQIRELKKKIEAKLGSNIELEALIRMRF